MRLVKASRASGTDVPVVNQAFAVLLVMCSTMGLLFAVTVLLLGDRCYNGLLVGYLPQILIWFWAASLNWLLGEVFRGYSEFRWASMLEGQFGGLGTTGGFLLIGTPLVYFAGIKVSDALWLHAIVAMLSAGLGLSRLWSIQPVRFQFRSQEFRSKAWSLYKDSVPVAFTNLTSTSMWYIELLLAGFWLPGNRHCVVWRRESVNSCCKSTAAVGESIRAAVRH